MIFVSQTPDGSEVRWQDRKRHLWLLSVAAPTVPAIGAVLIWATGTMAWAWLPLAFYFIAVPAMDTLIGEDHTNPPEAVVEELSSDGYYRALLHAALAVLWIDFLVVALVAGTAGMPLWAFLALAAGTGVAGGSAINVGHELGHKPNRIDRLAARLACALVGYGHFNIEHNRGHHVMVATPEDAASARMGETIWAFVTREIPGAAGRGWALERERLDRKGLPFWHWRNELLQGYAVSLAVAAALVAAFGWIMLPFLLVHHAMAWFQLSLANYVEHYGLKREKRSDGRYAPCEPRHSWNTNHIVSNLMLFHLQRHSDHHANPLRPYQALRNFDDLPRLPSGYPGSYVLAVIPPLWFRVMDPKVMAWAGGDIAKVNVDPALARRSRTVRAG